MMSLKNTNPIVIAQFSDSHLFADSQALHHGANVFQHLQQVLADINEQAQVDIIVFTGDLTQDHSAQSYQLFAKAVADAQLKQPVYYLAGNHDEPDLMAKYLVAPAFNTAKSINLQNWQIHLLDSKSDTPAGRVNCNDLMQIFSGNCEEKHQLLMMHHHPIDVGYFIDRHGLLNQSEFWQTIARIQNANANIKAIACGHVHNGLYFPSVSAHQQHGVDVYTCPATSIAFDTSKETVSSLGVPPSYRILKLGADGHIISDIISLY